MTVLPALLADALIPAHGLIGALTTLACAVAISLLLAAAQSTAWKRAHGVRGIVFSELMLWSFARRLWAERRLRRIGAAYASAALAGDGRARVDLLEGLSSLLERRNPYTYGHCRRVARHAERIAQAMHLSAAEVAEVRAAALVHDVGKVHTPVEILQKPTPLSAEEFTVIKRHAADGAEMLAPVRDRRLAAIVRHHHERVDGSGYPDGLRGEEIPLGARIVAVADTFDAITSHRPYRRARSQRDALAVLAGESHEKLDAGAVAAFLALYTRRRAIASVSGSAAAWARLAPAQLLPGGLLGGGSLAGVLPALGAAGLLAVTPGARYERAAREPSAAGAPALQAAFPAALGEGVKATADGGASPSPARSVHRRRSSYVRSRELGSGPASPVPVPAPSGSSRGSAAAPAPAGPSVAAPPLSAAEPSPRPVEAVVPAPALPPSPSVTTPTLTTPTVTVPVLKAPAVTVPSQTVPAVTVGAPGLSSGAGAASLGSAGATAGSVTHQALAAVAGA